MWLTPVSLLSIQHRKGSVTVEFSVGQKVVYPNYGVTRVEKIGLADWGGQEQECYHLRLLSNNAQIMVPKDNGDLVRLRQVSTKKKIDQLIKMLADGNIDSFKDWKGRYKQNLDKMRTGELESVAEVIKNLRKISERKSLSFREKKMYERAKHFLVSEISHVREITENEAEILVEDALDTCIEKRKEEQAQAS